MARPTSSTSGHAAAAIAAGRCEVALVTMAGLARSGRAPSARSVGFARGGFESMWGMSAVTGYALAAQRHMFEFGTTSAQLAEVKVAASLHAQHNPHAFLPNPVTVDEVLDSPVISSPLHRLDCCVVTDGGGAVVVVSPEVARGPRTPIGQGPGPGRGGEAHRERAHRSHRSPAPPSPGPRAFAEAGVTPADVDYVSIYDSFTITVVETIEDLGFCEKGEGGRFVLDGALVAPDGRLPFNTDGGGLCNNHPSNRGGMTKIIEAVRQLRGEAHPAVQVPDCDIALAHGTGGSIGTRMGSATLILGREDA